jgi:uncharacterized protein
MTPAADMAVAGAAALAAGAINAIAGGGSLITFPTLVAIGLSPVTASVTNTVALCPGYFGATLAQRRDLIGQGRRVAYVVPIAALGGVAGAWLLLHSTDRGFDRIVPFLLLLAAVLVGAQDKLRAWLFGRTGPSRPEVWVGVPVALTGIYGGYFGAGMGVMIVGALGIVLTDTLLRLNALKQTCTLATNLAAAAVFAAISDRIDWPLVATMAAGSLAGGAIGGKLASRIPATVLRWTIVAFGVALSAVYFVRAYGSG